MKKGKRKNKFIYSLFGYLLIIISLLFFLLLLYLNILSIKMILIILGILIVINLFNGFFLLHPLVKDKLKKFILFFTIIIIGIIGLLVYYLSNTLMFFTDISSDDYIVKNYSIIINDKSITSIDDLRNKKVGYYSLNELYNDEIPVSIDYDSYDDLYTMYQDLCNDKIKGILLDDSSISMLEENKDVYNYNSSSIYSFSVREKQSIESKDVDTVKESFNIYISGIDTYGSIASVSRSDVNIVASVNPVTKTILLTSIPRDYYVSVDGNMDKLTHAGLYGVNTSIKTIEDLLDININYYLKVNFTSVIEVVNILDGISVNSDYEFTAWDGTYFKEGINELNGEQALSFARERKSFVDGDKQRGKNQQEVIRAVINKATTSAIIIKYNNIISAIGPQIKTNMPQNDITALIKMQLRDKRGWTIIANSLDGTDSYEYTYSYKGYELYVMVPDEESISGATKMINEVLNGK